MKIPSIDRGIIVRKGKKMLGWHEVCEEWILLTERYCRLMGGNDACYNYKEQANLSILSGAAFRAGWVSVSESSIDKRDENDNLRKGRSDLCILGPHHNQKVYIEAKVGIRKYPHKMSGAERAENLLEKACLDVVDIDAEHRYGLCFIRWWSPINPVETSDNIRDFIEECLQCKPDILAWCFPPEMREFQPKKPENKKYAPGVVLLARSV